MSDEDSSLLEGLPLKRSRLEMPEGSTGDGEPASNAILKNLLLIVQRMEKKLEKIDRKVSRLESNSTIKGYNTGYMTHQATPTNVDNERVKECIGLMPCTNTADLETCFSDPDTRTAIASWLRNIVNYMDDKKRAQTIMDRLLDRNLQGISLWPSAKANNISADKIVLPFYFCKFMEELWISLPHVVPWNEAVDLFRGKLKSASANYRRVSSLNNGTNLKIESEEILVEANPLEDDDMDEFDAETPAHPPTANREDTLLWINQIMETLPFQSYDDLKVFRDNDFKSELLIRLTDQYAYLDDKRRAELVFDYLIHKDLQAITVWPSNRTHNMRQDKKKLPSCIIGFMSDFWLNTQKEMPWEMAVDIFRKKMKASSETRRPTAEFKRSPVAAEATPEPEEESPVSVILLNRTEGDESWMNDVISLLPFKVFADLEVFSLDEFNDQVSKWLERFVGDNRVMDDKHKIETIFDHLLDRVLQARVIWPSNRARNITSIKLKLPLYFIRFLERLWVTYTHGMIWEDAIEIFRKKLKSASDCKRNQITQMTFRVEPEEPPPQPPDNRHLSGVHAIINALKETGEGASNNRWIADIMNLLPFQYVEDLEAFTMKEFRDEMSKWLAGFVSHLTDDKQRVRYISDRILDKSVQSSVIWPSKNARNVGRNSTGIIKAQLPMHFVHFLEEFWYSVSFDTPWETAVDFFRKRLKNASCAAMIHANKYNLGSRGGKVPEHLAAYNNANSDNQSYILHEEEDIKPWIGHDEDDEEEDEQTIQQQEESNLEVEDENV